MEILSISWHSLWHKSPLMPENVLIAKAISVRATNNSLDRVKGTRRIKLHHSYTSHRSHIYVKAHVVCWSGDIGIQPNYRRWEILTYFHVQTARGCSRKQYVACETSYYHQQNVGKSQFCNTGHAILTLFHKRSSQTIPGMYNILNITIECS